MEKGIEQSKKQLQAIITQVQTFLDMHQVISAGPFLYAFMEEVINRYCWIKGNSKIAYLGEG